GSRSKIHPRACATGSRDSWVTALDGRAARRKRRAESLSWSRPTQTHPQPALPVRAGLVPRFVRIDGTNEIVGLGSECPVEREFRRPRPVRGGGIPVASTETRYWKARTAGSVDAHEERPRRDRDGAH